MGLIARTFSLVTSPVRAAARVVGLGPSRRRRRSKRSRRRKRSR